MNGLTDTRRLSGRLLRLGARNIVAALDIGTCKMSCLIAQLDGALVRVIGFAHQVSHGLQGGQIVDMVAAEDSIRATVDAAERMAGVELDRVLIGLSAARSHHYAARLALNGGIVGGREIAEVLAAASRKMRAEGNEILHAIPINYRVDNSVRLVDPRGMSGSELAVELHMVSAPLSPIRNLVSCLENCHLRCDKIVATPYAGVLAALVQDEMELGALLVDMGGGTTSFAICRDGVPIAMGVVPIGGYHITLDIARAFNLSLSTAERIKTLYGSAIAGDMTVQEQFELPGANGEQAITRRDDLDKIIHPRIEEIFELLAAAISQSDYAVTGNRIVLTGGAAQLSGVSELASQVLQGKARIGRPSRLSGLPEAAQGAGFTACAGLVAYARKRQADALLDPPVTAGLTRRLGEIVRRYTR